MLDKIETCVVSIYSTCFRDIFFFENKSTRDRVGKFTKKLPVNNENNIFYTFKGTNTNPGNSSV